MKKKSLSHPFVHTPHSPVLLVRSLFNRRVKSLTERVGRAQFSTFLCMLRMHITQPRMASLDSWDRTRSQTWRSAVPRWAAPVERLLLRNCATELASLLLRSLITRDRSKMKTAGMLPGCYAKKLLKKKESSKKEGESRGLVKRGDEVTTSPLSLSLTLARSPFLSVRKQQSGEGAVKPGCQNFPSEPEQKICSDKRRGVMESAGETSVRPLQSQLILYEVISPAETHSHPQKPLPTPAQEQI